MDRTLDYNGRIRDCLRDFPVLSRRERSDKDLYAHWVKLWPLLIQAEVGKWRLVVNAMGR